MVPEERGPIGSRHELTEAEAKLHERPASSPGPAEGTAALVERCLAGDEGAWREFVQRFQEPVFSLCYRMLKHRQDAEDVAQEALVRAVRNLHTWDPSRALMPWLMTITANRCRTALARRRRQPKATDFPIEPGDDAAGNPSETTEELTRALDELRDEYREVFVLFYQQELNCAEIGEVLKCPVGTVKTWLHRARQELAQRLRRRGVTDA